MKKLLVLVLHQEIKETSLQDDKDVLEQVKLVCNCLNKLNLDYRVASFSSDIEKFISGIKDLKPNVVFNLVESFLDRGKLQFVSAALLESLGIPFTGCSSSIIFTTTDKILTKQLLNSINVQTPLGLTDKNINDFKSYIKYIIKPVNEDASIGISKNSIQKFSCKEYLKKEVYQKHIDYGFEFFAEEFIDGREFNVSIIEIMGQPQILPLAEIIFSGFDQRGMTKIIDYKAKWDEDSFEYKNTNRTFCFLKEEKILLEEIKKICLKCWNGLNLQGYARIDLRIDNNLSIQVIDVNANPCISPDSGFVAACLEGGYSESEIINFILKAAMRSGLHGGIIFDKNIC